MTIAALEGQQLVLDLDAEHEEEEEADPPPLPAYVPAERIAAVIDRCWLDGGRRLDDLAARTGVPEATLSAIHRRRRQFTRFRVADQIVTRLDVWLWHTPPEQGGLADLYGSTLYRRKDAA